MASPILIAVRARRDLKESVQHTAQELAHLASIYGTVRVSLRYLAWRCRCCKQTIINHLNLLIARKIIRKQVLWLKGNWCETNRYFFLLAWHTPAAQTAPSLKTGRTLPPQEGEKHAGVQDELHNQRRWLRECSPGSDAWTGCQERIVYLEGLLSR